jgi:hypothetical protein
MPRSTSLRRAVARATGAGSRRRATEEWEPRRVGVATFARTWLRRDLRSGAVTMLPRKCRSQRNAHVAAFVRTWERCANRAINVINALGRRLRDLETLNTKATVSRVLTNAATGDRAPENPERVSSSGPGWPRGENPERVSSSSPGLHRERGATLGPPTQRNNPERVESIIPPPHPPAHPFPFPLSSPLSTPCH